MHDAYQLVPLIEKLPKVVECVACYGSNLLIGTREGCLLLYSIRKDAATNTYESNLEKNIKNFSKRPIVQLEVVPEYHILISVSDNIVSIHGLTIFTLIGSIEKTRGANCFTVDLQNEVLQSGETEYNLRLCVALKRKLQFFYWKNRQFKELRPDLLLQDSPRAMVWSLDTIFVGYKKDYHIVSLESDTSKELFSTGRQGEPGLLKVSKNTTCLSKDENCIFVDCEGKALQESVITWKDAPLNMVYDHPYIIAITTKSIEVRTIKPRFHIQSLECSKAKIICAGRQQQIYVASQSAVWVMAAVEIAEQVRQLSEKKEYALALQLVQMSDEDLAEREVKEREIRKMHAVELFAQHQFSQALDMLTDLKIDPSQVVGLFPNLLPEEFRCQLKYPGSTLPQLEGVELEKAILTLIEYLTQKRQEFMQESKEDIATNSLSDHSHLMRPRKQLLQIVDTTLVKCYVQTNDKLVASLLRLKDNHCHMRETERILKKAQKLQDLVTLYEKKGFHRKALDLLMKSSQKAYTELYGAKPIVSYLLRLGPGHLDMIFEYSEWVFKQYPQEALAIFTEDSDEVKALPRDEVFNFLQRVQPQLIPSYLEHVIDEWADESTKFHNLLLIHLLTTITPLYREYIKNTLVPARAGEESEPLGPMRKKLLRLLTTSEHYLAKAVMDYHPQDVLLEEKAILYGRMQLHYHVIHVYVTQLADTEAAEKYCQAVYDPNDDFSKWVFYDLLKLYLQPPPQGITSPNHPSTHPTILPSTLPSTLLPTHLPTTDLSSTDLATTDHTTTDNTPADYAATDNATDNATAALITSTTTATTTITTTDSIISASTTDSNTNTGTTGGNITTTATSTTFYITFTTTTTTATTATTATAATTSTTTTLTGSIFGAVGLSSLDNSSISSMASLESGAPSIESQNMSRAAKLIAGYSEYFDPEKLLDIIPDETPLRLLQEYIVKVLEHSSIKRRESEMQKNLLKAESYLTSQGHMKMKQTLVRVSEKEVCVVCKKKIGTSAFARYPNGVVVHYFCCSDVNKCPVG